MSPLSKYILIIFLLGILFGVVKLTPTCNSNTNTKIEETNNLQHTIITGRYLFFDRRLSVNNTRSCGTCHNPTYAFTDGYKRSLGIYADLHKRNTQPLFNLSYLKYLTAADSSLHTLAQQINNPLFNEHPAEMGVKNNEEIILKKIISDSLYLVMFKEEGKEISWYNIKYDICSFVESINSFNAPYDSYMAGNKNALTTSEIEGMNLFFSPQLKCFTCHGEKNFSTPIQFEDKQEYFFNTGMYNLEGRNNYPVYDMGLYDLTKQPKDIGKFRVPTLRNLAFTGPYLHDGSEASLLNILRFYQRGGRLINEGINKGDGKNNIHKSSRINGYSITEKQQMYLLQFLYSLSDSSFITNKNYQNPFIDDETKHN